MSMDSIAEIAQVCLRSRAHRGTAYLYEHFPSIAARIAAETRRELPPRHFKNDFIAVIEPKIKGFELVAGSSLFLMLGGPI